MHKFYKLLFVSEIEIRKMGKKVIFCIFVILFILFISIFSNFISAAVSLGNKSYNLEKNYAPGKALSGWINISIENEPASASFSNNINSKSMALIDFLGANSLEEGMGFRCFPIGCEKKYLLTIEIGKSALIFIVVFFRI